MKVSRNDLFYLLVKFHIFWRHIDIYFQLILDSMLFGKCYSNFGNQFFLNRPDPRRPDPPPTNSTQPANHPTREPLRGLLVSGPLPLPHTPRPTPHPPQPTSVPVAVTPCSRTHTRWSDSRSTPHPARPPRTPYLLRSPAEHIFLRWARHSIGCIRSGSRIPTRSLDHPRPDSAAATLGQPR
jgi:hypothetical protein